MEKFIIRKTEDEGFIDAYNRNNYLHLRIQDSDSLSCINLNKNEAKELVSYLKEFLNNDIENNTPISGEFKKVVTPYLIDYKCNECKEGVMRPTENVLTSYPPKYPHKCNKCGKMQTFDTTYPYVDYE